MPTLRSNEWFSEPSFFPCSPCVLRCYNSTSVRDHPPVVQYHPKIGSMWMFQGQQAKVSPGTNQKRYLAGSIHWRKARNAVFVPSAAEPPKMPRTSRRREEKIRIICDNAKTLRSSEAVMAYCNRLIQGAFAGL